MSKKEIFVQVDAEFHHQDGDGNYVFKTPFALYLQDKDGNSTKEDYVSVRIDKKGTVVSYI